MQRAPARYVLVTATVFAPGTRIGFLSAGAVALFAMYALSVVAALTAAAVLRRTVLRGPAPTLVLELPPARVPVLSVLLRGSGSACGPSWSTPAP
ncbi:MAG: hypothetical protein R2712_13065 [Vicinamibacterales bacterium]